MWIIDWLIIRFSRLDDLVERYWGRSESLIKAWYDRLKEYAEQYIYKARLFFVDRYQQIYTVCVSWYARLIVIADWYYDPFYDLITNRLDRLKRLRDDLYDRLTRLTDTLYVILCDYAEGLYSALADLARNSLSRLREIRDNLYTRLSSLCKELWDAVYDYAKNRATAVVEYANDLAARLRYYRDALESKARHLLESLWGKALDILESLYGNLAHLGRTIYDRVKTIAESFYDKLSWIADYFSRLYHVLCTIWDILTWVFSGDAWQRLFALLQNPVGAIWAWLWDTLEKYIEQWLEEHW